MNATKRLPEEIVKKIKQITIATRRALNGMLVGDTRTAIKGTGFDFDQIRAYNPGDDIRFIDWKASARTDTLLTKQFIEERNRTVHLLVDISSSSTFATTKLTKRDIAAQVASVIALSSFHGKDQVGLTLFSDAVSCVLPPASRLAHIHNCIEKVFAHQVENTGTDISIVIDHLLKVEKSKSLVFIVSDFIDESFDQKKLGQLAKKHDVVAVRCLDQAEQRLPSVGIVHITDIETGELVVLDTSNAQALEAFFASRIVHQNKVFAKYGIDLLEIAPHTDALVDTVVTFFKKRMRY